MGRARIVEHIENGLYRIVPIERDVELRTLRKQIEDLIAKMTTQEDVVAGRESELEAENDRLNDKILSGATHDAIQAQRHDCNIAEADYAKAVAGLNALKLNLAIIQKKYYELEEEDDPAPIEAWCADYSVNLTGEVDTIELDGDTSKTLIIAPGGIAPVIPDTVALTIPAHSATQAFYNWAVFPAWQRWRPTYREGIISAMYQYPADVGPYYASVTIVPSVSAAQKLEITPPVGELPERYSFDYMSCDYAAFIPGDRVVVAWPKRNWTEGVIVGFVNNPRPCNWHENLLVRMGDLVSVWCPENQCTILPPTEFMGDRFMSWYNRTIGELETESPYDVVYYVTPDVLEKNAGNYIDVSLDPRMPIRKWCKTITNQGIEAEPMTDNVELHDNVLDCHFYATMGNFKHSPPGAIIADNVGPYFSRPSPSIGATYAAYDYCQFFEGVDDGEGGAVWQEVPWLEDSEGAQLSEWDFQHIGAYTWYSPNTPEYAEICWSLGLENYEQGKTIIHLELAQTIESNVWQHWYDYESGDNAETDWNFSCAWTYHAFAGQTKEGAIMGHQVYDYDTATTKELSYDWMYRCPQVLIRSGSSMHQGFIYETGTLTETLVGGYVQGEIEVWVVAASDWLPLTAMETPGYDRSHNADFAAFLKTLYEAARVHHGYAANQATNWHAWTRGAKIYAYIPEEGLVYPYEIPEP